MLQEITSPTASHSKPAFIREAATHPEWTTFLLQKYGIQHCSFLSFASGNLFSIVLLEPSMFASFSVISENAYFYVASLLRKYSGGDAPPTSNLPSKQHSGQPRVPEIVAIARLSASAPPAQARAPIKFDGCSAQSLPHLAIKFGKQMRIILRFCTPNVPKMLPRQTNFNQKRPDRNHVRLSDVPGVWKAKCALLCCPRWWSHCPIWWLGRWQA